VLTLFVCFTLFLPKTDIHETIAVSAFAGYLMVLIGVVIFFLIKKLNLSDDLNDSFASDDDIFNLNEILHGTHSKYKTLLILSILFLLAFTICEFFLLFLKHLCRDQCQTTSFSLYLTRCVTEFLFYIFVLFFISAFLTEFLKFLRHLSNEQKRRKDIYGDILGDKEHLARPRDAYQKNNDYDTPTNPNRNSDYFLKEMADDERFPLSVSPKHDNLLTTFNKNKSDFISK
jgi:hypothetical protein